MISYDYEKSLKDGENNIYRVVNEIAMQVQETRDEFIFSTLSKYANDNFNIVVEKEELARAINLIRMCKKYGPGIDERLSTATQQAAYLNDAYLRGFQDGVTKEHDRLMDILEKENKDD